MAQCAMLETQRKVKAPVACSTITNISTGISFGESRLVGWPLGSRNSLPRFIGARFYPHGAFKKSPRYWDHDNLDVTTHDAQVSTRSMMDTYHQAHPHAKVAA